MKDGFSFNQEERDKPWVFLQWKGTDACFDFMCICGKHCHFDGDFAYTVQCPHCNRIYEMPFILFPREACDETYPYWREYPKMLDRDTDE